LLDGAATDAQRLGDVQRRAALLGQDDRLESDPDATFHRMAFGPGDQLLGSQVLVDVHRGGPPKLGQGSAPNLPHQEKPPKGERRKKLLRPVLPLASFRAGSPAEVACDQIILYI